jgi:dethiobiotin synthetase
MNYFITGIDTDSGKTLTSAIVCEALQADYWKPIQCGLPRDTDTVKSLVSNENINFYNEAYLLKTPASPHAAAKVEGIRICLDNIVLPQTNNSLVIEGAGGCLVPLNESDFVIDLAFKFAAPIILVADLYLGSINHTLLTVSLLKQRNALVKGIVFNGVPNIDSEEIILQHSGYKKLLHIHPEEVLTRDTIKKYAAILHENWHD